MFELIGVVVVAWLAWKIGKAVFAGLAKGTMLRAVEYAQETGAVPRRLAMEIIGQPELVKGVRKELAAQDRDFGALDVYEQYGLAIIEIHEQVTGEQEIKGQVKNILAPQIASLKSEGEIIFVDYITFVYVGALVLGMRSKDKKQSVTPAEIKDIIQHVFDEPGQEFAIENAWSILLHSSGFFDDLGAMLPLAAKEVAAGRGEYFEKYSRKASSGDGLATGPRPDLSKVSKTWFLEV